MKEMMMHMLLIAGLALGAATASDGALEHRVQLDHHSGPVAVRYSADVGVTHKQIGAVTTGGRPRPCAASGCQCHRPPRGAGP
ncbi:hypothetical protein P0F65_18650 [Sphingomonas sp. I4]